MPQKAIPMEKVTPIEEVKTVDKIEITTTQSIISSGKNNSTNTTNNHTVCVEISLNKVEPTIAPIESARNSRYT
jgi:acetamidase/formamidase